MSVTSIAAAGRDAVLSLLSDATYGFNGLMSMAAKASGLLPVWQPLAFDKPGSNFFLMQLTDATIDVLPTVPLLIGCLYVTGFSNKVLQKPMKFSGPVVVAFDLWPSWSQNKGFPGTEEYLDVFDDVVVDLMNRREGQQLAFVDPVVYKGNLTMRRGVPTIKGTQWRQQLRYEIPLEINRGF